MESVGSDADPSKSDGGPKQRDWAAPGSHSQPTLQRQLLHLGFQLTSVTGTWNHRMMENPELGGTQKSWRGTWDQG